MNADRNNPSSPVFAAAGSGVKMRQAMAPARPRLISKALALCSFLLAPLVPAQDIAHEPEREHWQQIGAIFEAMSIHAGSVVADIGAGDGFLTVRLSPLVGENGRIYAEDIAEKRLDGLRKRVADAHLNNITIINGSADDPRLPTAQLDAVVFLNAYHEVANWDEMLKRVHEALKPGGRLVIAEPSPSADGETRAQQMAKHRISAALVAEDMTRDGFTVIDTREKFAQTPEGPVYYSLVVARRGE
jgi:ubiquinone/menaquinone biosynthesis C-methylase UbiE